MEKDFNEKELDKLIRDWTDELLDADIDNQIADSLMYFVESENSEVDVSELIDDHIHQLAIEEQLTKRRKWKIFFSVAAASVGILIFVSLFLSIHDNGSGADQETLVAETQVEDKTEVLNVGKTVGVTDSCKMMMAEATAIEKSKVASSRTRKKNHTEKTIKQKETDTEQSLIETFAEINTGLANLVENANECLNMANVSLLPENLFSDAKQTNSIELRSDEYSSTQYKGQMQKPNVIETNLINALYEIRNLNIDLNFETENKKNEI